MPARHTASAGTASAGARHRYESGKPRLGWPHGWSARVNATLTTTRYGVPVRRPATPLLLAWLAVVAGATSIFSALTPEMAARLRLVQGLLPPGVPSAARTIALALGLG